jgi:hypothetical protein
MVVLRGDESNYVKAPVPTKNGSEELGLANVTRGVIAYTPPPDVSDKSTYTSEV